MDRETALSELTEAHAIALRLHERGVEDDAIALAVGIEPEGVRSLLDVAERKLAALGSTRPSNRSAP